MSRILIVAAIYAVIAVFTFGHSAANAPPPDCLIADKGVCTYRKLDSRTPNALGAGIFWPLYWSWEVQS